MIVFDYDQELRKVRAQALERRNAAWAKVPDRVLGIRLCPMTPARFSVLVGSANAFLVGGEPSMADIRNFIWFSSEGFNPDKPVSPVRRFLAMMRLKLAVSPLFQIRHRRALEVMRLALAVAQIREIVTDTFRDSLPGWDDKNGKPLAASLEAQLVDSFAREYHTWPLPQPVRHTPLRQLFQMARCIDRFHLGTEARYFDPEEHALDRRLLQFVN